MGGKPAKIKGRLGFTNYAVDGDFDRLLSFSLEHGFDLVQIAQDSSRFFPENIDSETAGIVASRFAENGVALCFHGPSDIPLLNRHEKIRLAGLERYFEMIDSAVQFGGKYFVIHPGRLAFYSVSKKEVIFMERKIPSVHLHLFKDSLERLLAHAGNALEICLENTYGLPTQFLEIVSTLTKERGLKLVWDTGHTELAKPALRERVIKFFQDNINSVRLGHLHDVAQGSDHQELGSGESNVEGYIEIFNTLGVDIVLEIFPEKQLLNSLDYLRKLQTVAR